MKKLLFLFVVILLVASCKKDDDTPAPVPEPTRYVIFNNTAQDFTNVLSYYFKDDQMFDLKSHGNVQSQHYSDTIATNHEYINVMFTSSGFQFKVVSPYNIMQNEVNVLEINNQTIVQLTK